MKIQYCRPLWWYFWFKSLVVAIGRRDDNGFEPFFKICGKPGPTLYLGPLYFGWRWRGRGMA